ncbi:MAG TPA: hypothetical protein VGM03_15405 [Phycisphaerae bacterium]
MYTKSSVCALFVLLVSSGLVLAQSGGDAGQPASVSPSKIPPELWALKLHRQPPADLPEGGAPPNDACETAAVAVDGDNPFNNFNATNDGPIPGCGALNNDVWFNYSASATGTAVASLCAGTFFDTVMIAYGGCACPAGAELACDDDFCGFASGSQIAFSVTQGQCYKIRIGSFTPGDTSAGVLNISVIAPLLNNNCADAIPISEGDTPFSTVGATTDGNDHVSCYFGFPSNVNQDIWYNYTAPCSGDVTVSLCSSAIPYDSKLAIYDGCVICPPTDAQLLNCDDDGCFFAGPSVIPGQNPATVSVIAGNCYRIRVGGFGGATGSGTINISNTGSPCTTAVTIVSANPPASNPYGSGRFRDVLQNSTPALVPQGIGVAGTPAEGPYTYANISVTFSGTISPAPTPGNIVRTCTDIAANGQGDCPNVTTVTGSGAGPYAISLSAPPPPRECITFTFAGTLAGQKLQYQVLPGDTNLDGNVSTQDLLFLVQSINNGMANVAGNRARFNINRSNETGGVVVNTQDLLRLVQLLNGTQATQVFNGATVAVCP